MFRKAIPYIIVSVMAAMAFGSCNNRKAIPDDELSDIFRDIYIVNTFANQNYGFNYDSINIYEPILKDHGYTSRDFLYTVGSFTRRKSTRLSDIVEDAIRKLDAINVEMNRRAVILDKIDSAAFAVSNTVVYRDSLIRIRDRKEDSAKMHIKIPARHGSYKVTYYYYVDSTDTNRSLNNYHIIYDSLGRTSDSKNVRLRQRERIFNETKLEAPANAKELSLSFVNYLRDAKKPFHVDIDSLVVVYYPPLDEAHEKLLRSYVDFTLMINGKPYYEYYLAPAAPTGGALPVRPPLVAEKPDTVAGS